MTPVFDVLCAIDHLQNAKRKLEVLDESDMVVDVSSFIHQLDLFVDEKLREVGF